MFYTLILLFFVSILHPICYLIHCSLSHSQLYWKDLCDDIALQGGEEGKFTGLIWPLGAEDPDDAFSSVPYEKVGFVLNCDC